MTSSKSESEAYSSELLPNTVSTELFEKYAESRRVPGGCDAFAEEFGQATTTWLETKLGCKPRNIGKFWFSNELPRCVWEYLYALDEFFTADLIRTDLLPIIAHTRRKPAAAAAAASSGAAAAAGAASSSSASCISRRALDWLVTNFSKKRRVMYVLRRSGTCFNIYLQYKATLSRYRREVFDPFRRYRRVYFLQDSHMYSTTVGQLNFLRWAISNEVIAYARSHVKEIEEDQLASTRRMKARKEALRAAGKPQVRMSLSAAPYAKCIVYCMPEKAHFVSPK